MPYATNSMAQRLMCVVTVKLAETYDTKSAALDAEVLRKLHATVPLKDLLGIKGNAAS
jgi:hypothetical protein